MPQHPTRTGLARRLAQRRATTTRQAELDDARRGLDHARQHVRDAGTLQSRTAASAAERRFNQARRARDRQLPTVQRRRQRQLDRR